MISAVMGLILAVMVLAGCQSAVEKNIQKAVRDTKYSAYELVGVQKRDLLKREVSAAREEQKEAGEDFKNAYEKLKALYGFEGGELEKAYRKVDSAYEDAQEQAETVRGKIRKVETTAGDLFSEWKKEINEIQSGNLKLQSQKTLAQTENRYGDMIVTLKRAEASMNPVLAKLKDQVLFLKHNLNAKAIGSLKGEGMVIEKDVQRLLQEMNTAIAAADKFIQETDMK